MRLTDALSTEDYLTRFQGDPEPAVSASRARLSDPSLSLRNAEHNLFSQYLMDRSGGTIAPFLPLLVGGYSGAKGLAQLIQRLSPTLGHAMPESLTQASPPSWEEMYWGLEPLWKRRR